MNTKRIGRWTIRAAMGVLAILIAGELFARFGLGLGDPPLSVADPEIEYLFAPSSTYQRFGNTISYNAWSMRSDEFPKAKADPDELRILILGDSVVNGGNLTDQSQLATTLVQDRLARRLGRPVVVGNVSAGSWGPGNLLAYVDRFGLFDADVVIVVLSSHDAADVRTFSPIVGVHPGFPDHTPWLALQEAVFRYLPRYLPGKGGDGSQDPSSDAEQRDVEPKALAALSELLRRIQGSGAQVALVQHWDKQELEANQPFPGHEAVAAVAAELDVETLEDGPALAAAIEAGQVPYRDHIHPNVQGQAVLAEVLEQAVISSLEERATDAKP